MTPGGRIGYRQNRQAGLNFPLRVAMSSTKAERPPQKAERRESSTPGKKRRPSRRTEAAAERVWLAGLGALAVDDGGTHLFRKLAERGRRMTAKRGEPGAILRRLGVPARAEVQKLTERADDLARFAERWKKLREDLEAVSPPRVVTDAEMKQSLRALIAREATAIIWQEEYLAPSQVAVALGAKESNREKASSLRKRSWLLGIPRDRGYLYPAFQIDLAHRELYPEVRQVNEALGAANDPWGVASWWVSTNDRLGARPADLVGSRRAEELVQAARAVTAPIG